MISAPKYPAVPGLMVAVMEAAQLGKPMGPTEDRALACNILRDAGLEDDFIGRRVDYLAGVAINGDAVKSNRLSEEVKLLEDIARSSRVLSRSLGKMTPEIRTAVSQVLAAHGFEIGRPNGSQLYRPDKFNADNLISVLDALPGISEWIKSNIPRDSGGNTTVRVKLRLNNPMERFITEGIGIFVDYRGAESVTTAISTPGRGTTFHAFLSAVFSYALGRELGHEKLFKKIVKEYQSAICSL